MIEFECAIAESETVNQTIRVATRAARMGFPVVWNSNSSGANTWLLREQERMGPFGQQGGGIATYSLKEMRRARVQIVQVPQTTYGCSNVS